MSLIDGGSKSVDGKAKFKSLLLRRLTLGISVSRVLDSRLVRSPRHEYLALQKKRHRLFHLIPRPPHLANRPHSLHRPQSDMPVLEQRSKLDVDASWAPPVEVALEVCFHHRPNAEWRPYASSEQISATGPATYINHTHQDLVLPI